MDKIDKNKWIELRKTVGFASGAIPRLNVQHLDIKNHGKDYAEVIFFGDTHWGSPQCDKERARKMIEYCVQKEVYVLLMGDLLEFATRGSVGAGVYEQLMNPHKQFDEAMEMLMPLAQKGLILGLLRGNHELLGMGMGKQGSPKIKFHSERHDFNSRGREGSPPFKIFN